MPASHRKTVQPPDLFDGHSIRIGADRLFTPMVADNDHVGRWSARPLRDPVPMTVPIRAPSSVPGLRYPVFDIRCRTPVGPCVHEHEKSQRVYRGARSERVSNRGSLGKNVVSRGCSRAQEWVGSMDEAGRSRAARGITGLATTRQKGESSSARRSSSAPWIALPSIGFMLDQRPRGRPIVSTFSEHAIARAPGPVRALARRSMGFAGSPRAPRGPASRTGGCVDRVGPLSLRETPRAGSS